MMSLKALLDMILGNEHLTRGLDDPEARILVEWLVEQAEAGHTRTSHEAVLQQELTSRVQRARGIARFVRLWCHDRLFGAALQLAATERFAWPLPTQPMDACDLMSEILAWESDAQNVRMNE